MHYTSLKRFGVEPEHNISNISLIDIRTLYNLHNQNYTNALFTPEMINS